MKKSFRILLTLVLAFVMVLSLTACISHCEQGKHSFVDIAPVEATCTTAGTLAHKHCIVCDLYFDANGKQITKEQTVVAPLGHDLTETPAVAPTCTTDGNVQYWECGRCDKKFSDANATTEISAVIANKTGHVNVSQIAKVDATCTTAGVLAHEKCDDCDTLFVDGQVVTAEDVVIAIAPTAHKLTHHDLVANGCATDGTKEHWSCDHCDKLFSDNAGANEVTADSLVIPSAHKPATTWTQQNDTHYHACTVDGCNAKLDQANCSGGVATCSAKAICQVCQNAYGTVDTDAHAWGNWTVTTSATCSAKGVETRVCAHNGDHKETRDVAIDANAHAWNNGVITTPATCTEKGVKTFTCQHNDTHTKTEDVAIVESAHEWGNWTVTTPATCSTKGEETRVCAHNDEHTETRDVAIDANAHAWGNWTVTTPATCSAKGVETRVCAHNGEHKETREIAIVDTAHAWDNGVITTPATCTATGVKTYTCQHDASHTKTETVAIDEDAHDLVNHEAKPATCKEGEKWWDAYVICSRCDYTTKVEKDSIEHTSVEDKAVDPSCEETGLTAGSHCDVCDKVIVAQEKVPANGHAYGDLVEKVSATCQQSGMEEHFFCDVCDSYFQNDQDKTKTTQQALIIPVDNVNGHSYINMEGKPATCTDDGYTAYKKCEICNNEDGKTVITADGHNYGSLVVKVSATCSATGVDAHYFCEDCKTYFTSAKVETTLEALVIAKDPTAHKKSATLSSDSEGHYYQCQNDCGEKLGYSSHNSVVDSAVDATCTTVGKTEGSHCDKCNYVIVAQSELPKLGHDPEDAYTPTADGSKHYHLCKNGCGAILDAEEHTPVEIPAVDASCTEPGKTAGSKCEDCGYIISAQQTADAKGHTYGTLVVKTPATCSATGVDAHYRCSVCNEYFQNDENKTPTTLDDLTLAIDPNAHDLEHTGGFDDNKHYGSSCKLCDYVADDEAHSAQGLWLHEDVEGTTYHYQLCSCGYTGKFNYEECIAGPAVDENVVPSTCTVPGSKDVVVYCTTCHREISRQTGVVIQTIPHSYKQVEDSKYIVTPATCTSPAVYKESCSCGATNDVTFNGSATVPHTYGELQNKKPATCSATGTDAHYRCTECDGYFKNDANKTPTDLAGITLPIDNDNGHNWQHVEGKDATCTEDGYSDHNVCSICNKSKGKEDFAKTGHTEIADQAVAPTCTKTGLTAGSHCGVCGVIIIEQNVVSMLAHSYGDLVPAVAPTCSAGGNIAYYQCSSCKGYFAEDKTPLNSFAETQLAVDSTAHAFGELHAKVDATCTTAGTKEYKTCQHCKQNFDKDGNLLVDISIAIDTNAHAWGEISYAWTSDNSECVASRSCTRENCSKLHSETATVASIVTQERTCTLPQLSTLTATFTNDAFQTQTKTNIQTLAEMGHDYVSHDAKAPTCTEIGWDAYNTCSRCDYTTKVEKPALGHDHVEDVTAPTCTEKGYTTYTCSRCASVQTGAEIPALGHTAKESWSSDENGHWHDCSICGNPAEESVAHKSKYECVTEGHREFCSICDYEITETTEHVSDNNGGCISYKEDGTGCNYVEATTNGITITSFAEAIEIANGLDSGKITTGVYYYLLGRIVSVDNTTYGNLTLTDANGKLFNTWGLYLYDGTRYDDMETMPIAGNVVIVFGQIKNDGGTPRILNAKLVELNANALVTSAMIAEDLNDTIKATVDADFTLPSVSIGTVIWSSNSDAIVIDNETLQATVSPSTVEDLTVTLTATVTYDGQTEIKTFTVTIPKIIEGQETVVLDTSLVTGYNDASEIDSWSSGNVTITFGGSGTSTKFYSAGIRAYYNNTITIKVADGYVIKSVEFSFASDDKNTMTANEETIVDNAWSGEELELLIKIGAKPNGETKGHRKISKITIIIVKSCEHTPTTGKPVELADNHDEHQVTCSKCSQTYLVAHDYDDGQWKEAGENHSRTCKECDHVQIEAHTFVDGACSECNASAGYAKFTKEATNATITISNESTIRIGDPFEFTVVTDEGYFVTGIQVDGTNIELKEDGIYTATSSANTVITVTVGDWGDANPQLKASITFGALPVQDDGKLWESNGIIVVNTSSNTSQQPIRVYKNETLSIQYTSMLVIKIYIDQSDSSKINSAIVSDLTNGATITANEDESIITIVFDSETDSYTSKAMSNQTRISKIEVYTKGCQHPADKVSTVAKSSATCTTAGTEAHVLCSECGRMFADNTFETQLMPSDVVLPVTGHSAPEGGVRQQLGEDDEALGDASEFHKVQCACGTWIPEKHDFSTNHACACGLEETSFCVTVNNNATSDDVTYTMSVDGQIAEKTQYTYFNNTLVTLTIDNVPEGKKAVVTIGDSEEAVNLTDNTYTFTVTADITLNISVEDIGAGGEESNTPAYVKVTTAQSDWSGKYLLVYEKSSSEAIVINGSLETVDATNNILTMAIDNNKIAVPENDNCYVEIESITGGYVIKTASGQYMYVSSNKNGLSTTANQATAAKYPLTITLEDAGTVLLTVPSGPSIKFNSASDQNRFRYYKSGQSSVTLYKFEG